MKFEPQCKTSADVHREWARVLEMCEGTSIAPISCFKQLIATRINPDRIDFNQSPCCFEFAIAIVEGRPVFCGDDLYAGLVKATIMSICNVDKSFRVALTDGEKCQIDAKFISWNPSKPKEEPKFKIGEVIEFVSSHIVHGKFARIENYVGEDMCRIKFIKSGAEYIAHNSYLRKSKEESKIEIDLNDEQFKETVEKFMNKKVSELFNGFTGYAQCKNQVALDFKTENQAQEFRRRIFNILNI